MNTKNIKFHKWSPEENIELFIKIISKAHEQNKQNKDLIQINKNTWVEKDKNERIKI